MKILHIITRLDKGGSAEAVLQIGERLSKRGHDVKIITGLTKDPQEDFRSYSERTGVPLVVIPELRREVSPLYDLYSFYRLYRLIKKEKPEIVHTHTSKAGILGRWAAWLSGVKIIIHSTHGHVFYGYFGGIATSIFLWAERTTSRITNKVTTLTELEIEDYQRLRLGKKDKFITVPYGIDTKKYQMSDRTKEEMRRILGISAGDKVVGWIGRLVPVKDCGTFLKAASLLKNLLPTHPSPYNAPPPYILPLEEGGKKGGGELKVEAGGIKFLVVGDGPERQKHMDTAERLGIEVIFTGTRKDIYDIIPLMDILVLSSLNEGLGRVLIEAMAAGKPVVATRVGGVPEVVIEGKTGIIVPPSSPEEMASAVMKILANPEMADSMGEEGRKRAERFDIRFAVERLEALYRNLS